MGKDYLDSLNEKQLFDKAKKSMENIHDLIDGFKEFKKEFTGTEHNPEGGFFNEMRSFKKHSEQKFKTIEDEISGLKKFQTQQQTGWSLGKWIFGGVVATFLASRWQELKNLLNNIF